MQGGGGRPGHSFPRKVLQLLSALELLQLVSIPKELLQLDSLLAKSLQLESARVAVTTFRIVVCLECEKQRQND